MSEKKPIDRLRESAGQMKIGPDDDASEITAMLTMGDILYTIKEAGIYAVKLADAIDPERLNPHIPNTQQRVIAYGSDNELVGRTLLTAISLFKKSFLPPTFDCERAVTLSLEAMKDIVAMYEAKEAFHLAERLEVDKFNHRQQVPRSLLLPAIGDVQMHCKTFCQKADHVSHSLFSIAKLFYGKNVGNGGFESLAELVVQKYGEEDSFSKFAKDVAPRLKYLRNVRNCFEHPIQQTQMAIVSDFNLGADGNIYPPMIEVLYRSEHYSPVPISQFMADAVDGLSGIFESMLAHLCNKHVQSFSGFPIQVVEFPPERRQREHKNVRFTYGAQINGQMVPIG